MSNTYAEPFDNPYSVSKAAYDARIAAEFTETEFQNVVIAEAVRRGYLVYHTHDSRRSQRGFPDLTLVNEKLSRLIFRELKTMKGTARPDQTKWLEQLRAVGQDAEIWRPNQWVDGTIAAELAQADSRPTPARTMHVHGVALREGTRPEYSTTADAQNVIRYLTEQLGMKLQPWQKAALAAAMVDRRVTVTKDTNRADLKTALTRIHPNR